MGADSGVKDGDMHPSRQKKTPPKGGAFNFIPRMGAKGRGRRLSHSSRLGRRFSRRQFTREGVA